MARAAGATATHPPLPLRRYRRDESFFQAARLTSRSGRRIVAWPAFNQKRLIYRGGRGGRRELLENERKLIMNFGSPLRPLRTLRCPFHSHLAPMYVTRIASGPAASKKKPSPARNQRAKGNSTSPHGRHTWPPGGSDAHGAIRVIRPLPGNP